MTGLSEWNENHCHPIDNRWPCTGVHCGTLPCLSRNIDVRVFDMKSQVEKRFSLLETSFFFIVRLQQGWNVIWTITLSVFITKRTDQYSPSCSIEIWVHCFWVSFSLVPPFHLHTSSIISQMFPLQHRLSRHPPCTIFLSLCRHRSLYSPHTKYLTLCYFPSSVGSASILLPRALWEIVVRYCFWCRHRPYEVILNATCLYVFTGSAILLCVWIPARPTVPCPPL